MQTTPQVNNYKGHTLFNDVDNVALRTFNRCTMMRNVSEDHGEPFAISYGAHLSEATHKQMLAMFKYIDVKGAEAVLLEISKGEI